MRNENSSHNNAFVNMTFSVSPDLHNRSFFNNLKIYKESKFKKIFGEKNDKYTFFEL
jgi:hypothetical protein